MGLNNRAEEAYTEYRRLMANEPPAWEQLSEKERLSWIAALLKFHFAKH